MGLTRDTVGKSATDGMLTVKKRKLCSQGTLFLKEATAELTLNTATRVCFTPHCAVFLPWIRILFSIQDIMKAPQSVTKFKKIRPRGRILLLLHKIQV